MFFTGRPLTTSRTAISLILPERVRGMSGTSSITDGTWRCVELARGDFVWIAEADDLAEPNFLEMVVPAFDDADVMMSYCKARQVDAEGRVLAEDYHAYTGEVSATQWAIPIATRAQTRYDAIWQ